jgi:two-component system sensor histidine kinase DctS
MGEMASTLAHELNQPLAAITSYNTGCLNKLESGNFTAAQLKEALGKLAARRSAPAASSAACTTSCARANRSARPATSPKSSTTRRLHRGDGRKRGARIVREIQGMRPVLADRVMLEQVLLNLMRNGIDAMGERRPSAAADVKLSQVDQAGMEIRRRRPRPGIEQEPPKKAVQPFFSTKAEGMGMGLNICRSIIESTTAACGSRANPEGGSSIFTLPIGRQ